MAQLPFNPINESFNKLIIFVVKVKDEKSVEEACKYYIDESTIAMRIICFKRYFHIYIDTQHDLISDDIALTKEVLSEYGDIENYKYIVKENMNG